MEQKYSHLFSFNCKSMILEKTAVDMSLFILFQNKVISTQLLFTMHWMLIKSSLYKSKDAPPTFWRYLFKSSNYFFKNKILYKYFLVVWKAFVFFFWFSKFTFISKCLKIPSTFNRKPSTVNIWIYSISLKTFG